mmetsp:Transcript_2166/g.8370  ORF Transcript_2166/g.8370 Transcript_2166/m.8370 type:complete len:217 (+) Transcript_2166:733-1383(+)
MGEHDDSRASRGSAGATRLPEAAGVAGLLGQWRGDATIRWSKGALSVAKQDLTLKRDGDVFFRSLSIADMRGDHVDELRKFGVTRPSEAAAEDLVDVVAFEDGAALVHFSGAAAYALAPLRVQDGVAFHVEAGMLVEEAADERGVVDLNGQFPISTRPGFDPNDVVEESPVDRWLARQQLDGPAQMRRHLARSVRLYYPDGLLASVTTSYHRRDDD